MTMDVATGLVKAYEEDARKYLVMEAESGTGAPYLDYVGGTMESGESPLEAFLREFNEETGFRPEKVMDEIEGYPSREFTTHGDSYRIHPHRVTVENMFEPELHDEEHVGYQWMTRGEMIDHHHRGILNDGRFETLCRVEDMGYQDAEFRFSGEEIDAVVRNFDI